MEQLDFIGVVSPCIGVCSADDSGYCKGCMRKRNERFEWNTFTDSQKQHVIKLCRQRYARKKRGTVKRTKDNTAALNTPQQDLF
jgi:predicted Fe-S protein YdhL (DUF1289 family)